jgi:Ca2+-binding EF-hand superfamily protein
MNMEQFKEMMGILGHFYLSERMFAAIDRNNDGFITQEDYLTYIDILTYGT